MEQFRENNTDVSLEPRPLLAEEVLLNEFNRVAENERGEPLTWGATPLVLSPDVVLQQKAVKAEISRLFEGENVPSYVTPTLADYIEALNLARTVNRESHNMNSYAYRGKTDFQGIPFDILEVLDRAVKGSASPAELLLTAQVFEIPTIELASLTHPYGQRMNQLEPMRAAIQEATMLLGGERVYDQQPLYEVKSSNNPHDTSVMEGLHMTRKTLKGILPDGTEIMERSSFVLRIDALPPAMAEKIRSIPFENDKFWANKVRRAEKLYELVPTLLDRDAHEIAIPISTTVVAINPTLEKKLLTEEAMVARRLEYLHAHRSKI